jgi:multidrug efflux pump subunit AcrB
VHKALAELKLQRPDVELVQAFDFVTPVQEEYDGSLHLLYEGASLAVLVVWLFLRDWRATFVSAIALPMSVIPAFIGMYLLGFSINVVTLLALSLVVGILVDDAIVEVENIVRHPAHGQDALPGGHGSGGRDRPGRDRDHVHPDRRVPAHGLHERRGGKILQAVRLDRLAGGVRLPGGGARVDADDGRLHAQAHRHRRGQGCALDANLHALRQLEHEAPPGNVHSVGALLLRLRGADPAAAHGFIPPDDNSQTQVYLELPPGATLEQTKATAEQARLMIAKVEHVTSVYTTIGAGSAGTDPFAPSGAAEARKATLTILLTDRGDRPRKQGIENKIRTALEPLPGVRSKVGLGGSGEKYILVLTGEDPQALSTAALAVEKDLRTIPGFGQVASTASLIRPEIAVRPDFARPADLGVTSAAIAETLRIATSGDYDVALPKLNLSQRQVPIVVKLAEDARKDLSLLGRLAVPGARGPVMLGQVATMELTGGPAVIDRYDRSRNINFEIELSACRWAKWPPPCSSCRRCATCHQA